MEKNRFLGPYCQAIGLITLFLVLNACAIPRIILLRDPLTPEEHVNLGLSYEKNGEYDAALREYTTASKKLPIAYLYIGNISFQKNNFDEAEKAYKLAISKTDDPRAYNNLAWLYFTSDRKLEEAEKLAGRAVALSPHTQDYTDTLTQIIKKRKDRGPY